MQFSVGLKHIWELKLVTELIEYHTRSRTESRLLLVKLSGTPIKTFKITLTGKWPTKRQRYFRQGQSFSIWDIIWVHSSAYWLIINYRLQIPTPPVFHLVYLHGNEEICLSNNSITLVCCKYELKIIRNKSLEKCAMVWPSCVWFL